MAQVGAAKALHTRDLKSGLDVSDEALGAAWNAVRDDHSHITWATFSYAAGGTAKLAVDGTGTGFDSLREAVSDEKVVFGGLRAKLGGAGRSPQQKYFSFMVVGESVGGIKKGKAAVHKNAVFNNVLGGGLSGELVFDSEEDFTLELVLAQVQKLTGAETVDLG